MTARIHDPEVQRLAAIASIIEPDYRNAALDWAYSPFGWIKALPSRTLGKVGEALMAKWCAAKGLDVTRSPDSDADRVISGLRAEIKTSTLWKRGTYTFQQVRDQDYSIVVCLGISPFDVHCWVIPKADAMTLWQAGTIKTQHGGSRDSDTAWITVNPSELPDWIRPYGGTLSAGFASLKALTRKV